MSLTRLPARRAALVALVALLVLGATACTGLGPVGPSAAAEVGGTTITSDDVFALLEASKRTEAKQSEGSDSASSSFVGTGLNDTWQMASFSQALRNLILREVLDQALDERGIEVTQDDRAQARAQLEQQAGGAEALDKADKVLVDWSIDAGAAQLALSRSFSDASDPEGREQQLRDMYEQARAAGGATEVCVSAIYSDSEEAAQAVKDRVDGGDDFAEVAQAESVDDQTKANGGELGCGALSDVAAYVGPELTADSASGDVLAPYRSEQAGQRWIVTRIDSIEEQSFEDVRDQLEQNVPDDSQGSLQRGMSVLLRRADVTVASKYGTWDAKTGQVTPPAGAPRGEPSPTPGSEDPGVETVPGEAG